MKKIKDFLFQLGLIKKIILLVVILAIGYFSFSKLFLNKNGKVTYQTEKVTRGNLIVTVSGSGTVTSTNSSNITTEATGVVTKIYVKDGDLVKTGDKIAEIELDLEGQQKSSQAWSSYQSAKNSLQTTKDNLYSVQADLFTKWQSYFNLATSSKYENGDKTPNTAERQSQTEYRISEDNWLLSEAKYKSQQKAIEQAQLSLNSAWYSYQQASPIIYAPISGTVSGNNYKRYIASYKSESLKIYALLTVPDGVKPKEGWPVIIFNHGYIPPREYRTTERYIAYVDGFARSGYIVFRSDYRGHDRSEGTAGGAYGSNGYTIDILNAVASIKKYKDANPNKVGMWGHSMGGYITLRNMVVNRDIKAGVIWAGVVASYPDLINNWRRGTFTPPTTIPSRSLGWRTQLINKYGTPEKNPEFWNSISANSYLQDISGPLQLHHGTADTSVPILFSEKLAQQMKQAGKVVELYKYEGDDHNIANNFNIAIQRSVEFFNKYLKGGEDK